MLDNNLNYNLQKYSTSLHNGCFYIFSDSAKSEEKNISPVPEKKNKS